MAQFNVPESPSRNVYQIEQFRGVDFTSSPEIVTNDKSPNAYNMVRDAIGTVRKSVGYKCIADYNGVPIYGYHKLREDDVGLVHAGDKLYRDDRAGNHVVMYEGLNERPSVSFELDDRLWIIDGKELLIYNFLSESFKDAKSSYKYEDTHIPVSEKAEVHAVEHIVYEKGRNTYRLPRGSVSNNYFVTSVKIKGEDLTFGVDYTVQHSSLVFNNVTDSEVHVDTYVIGYESNGKAYVRPCSLRDVKEYRVNVTSLWVESAMERPYVPVFAIAQPPKGGGVMYEDLNLLSDKVIEQFYCAHKTNDEGEELETWEKDFFLQLDDIDPDYIKVEKFTENGDWEEVNPSEYTFNLEKKRVRFKTAPEKVISGQDDIRITYKRKNREKYYDRINRCTIGILYGVGGASDRLFLSGNPDYINYDWYSGQFGTGSTKGDNLGGAYFADTAYGVMGNESSAIVGYSIINNLLATHKDEVSDERTVIIRQGRLVSQGDTEVAAFPIYNTLQGPGAIAPRSFAYLTTEPMFLTGSGIYSITSADTTGEKYSQRRSYFLNGRLLNEANLRDSFAVMYNDMYCLFVNNSIYILDGLQSLSSNNYDPYSTRQYAGFYRTNVPAISAWNYDRTLCFGTKDGKIFQFFTDVHDPNSYNDDGKPIEAMWETAEIFGDKFYKNKTFRWLAVKLTSEPSTSIKAYAYRKGIWKYIKDEYKKTRFFEYPWINYGEFSYSTDDTSRTIPAKIRLRRLDKAKFRFVNNEPNQAFGLVSFAVEYVVGNNYKG